MAELRGWVLYDGDCPRCAGWAGRCERMLTRRGFDLAPLQTPWVDECLEGAGAGPRAGLRVVMAAGASFSGAEAVVQLARFVWWAWPLAALGGLPGGMPLLRAAWRRLAAAPRSFLQGSGLTNRLPLTPALAPPRGKDQG